MLQYFIGNNNDKIFINKRKKSNKKNSHFLVFIVAILIPLHFLTYRYGINIAGISPPDLPFRISGILFYLTKYIIPFYLIYIYWIGDKKIYALLGLTLYAYVLGVTTISRSIPVSIIIPLLLIAIYKKEKFKSLFLIINIIVIFMLTTQIRNDIYTIENNQLIAKIDKSPIENIINVFLNKENFINFYGFINTLNEIFNRIEGFKNLVFSYTYNPELVAQPWIFLLRMISWNFGEYSSDNHNLQWVGEHLPDNFVLGGGLLSNALIIGNFGFIWLILLAIITAVLLYIIEFSVNRFQINFKLDLEIKKYIIIFLTFMLFTGPGSPVILSTCLILIIINFLIIK
jgi:hypothetical protein